LQSRCYSAVPSLSARNCSVAASRSKGGDPQQGILDFLDWDDVDEESFASDVRIVLASHDFSRELTTAVMWLSGRDLDIRCIRMRPYRFDDRLLLSRRGRIRARKRLSRNLFPGAPGRIRTSDLRFRKLRLGALAAPRPISVGKSRQTPANQSLKLANWRTAPRMAKASRVRGIGHGFESR